MEVLKLDDEILSKFKEQKYVEDELADTLTKK